MSREEELLQAVRQGNLPGARELLPGKGAMGRLLGRGFNINARDKQGNTALLHAAKQANVNIATLLLEHEADVNARNDHGDTPLFHAAGRGSVEMTSALVCHGADVNARNVDNCTALHRACGPEGPETSPEVVHILLDRGADPNAKGNRGETPLLVCARHGTSEVAELLIAHKAALNESDRDGVTPLRAAIRAGNFDVVDALREHGARDESPADESQSEGSG